MQTLISDSRSFNLPGFKPEGFRKIIDPNFSKNYTLDGTLFVDFYHEAPIRGGYIIEFDVITREEWDSLRLLYGDQFTNREFLRFNDTDRSIAGEEVFLNLPKENTIAWANNAAKDVTILLEPANASSN